jgi:tRNA A-37 threonylcarbamoyl transferase component Bud32/tetratricopeptide (TPR) repeat protein
VDDPVTTTLPPDGSVSDAIGNDAPPLSRATCVGRYIVLECIGRGGMGVVYRAYDPDLHRTIAVKLVRADSRNPDHRQRLRARLMREAQALARLSHSNVVTVYDVGTFDDGVFVAMELVDGVTLTHFLEEHAPSVSRILELFGDAGRGLAAAHAVGIVHRDFKPDNVIVTRNGKVARVLDFGLAHPSHDAEANAMRDDEPAPIGGGAVTEAGTVLGTPGYMAPEQLDGDQVDARADQFSFCVALHEALFGSRPGAAPNLIASRTASGARVPQRIRAVLRRGLATDRAARYPSMQALLDELAPPKRRRLEIAGAATVALAIGAVVFVATGAPAQPAACEGAETKLAGVWDAARKSSVRAALRRHGDDVGPATVEHALDRYTAAWVSMHTASCRATHVLGEQSPELLDLRTECLDRRLAELDELTDLLIAADPATANRAVASVQGLSPIEDCASPVALRDVVPPTNPALSRTLRLDLARARAQLLLGKYEEVERRAHELAIGGDTAGDRWLQASAIYLGARAARERGHGPVAEEQLYRAIEIAESGRAADVVADAWITLAWITGADRGRPVEGLRLAGVASGVLKRLGGNPRLESLLEDHIGVLNLDRGELALARRHLERGLALREQLYGKGSEYAVSLQHLALLERASGNIDKALGMLQESRRLAEAELGPRHPDVLAMLGAEGATLYELERYEEANALLERGLPLAEQGMGGESEMVASFLTNLGLARWKLKRFPEAKAAFTRGRAIAERTDPEGMRVVNLDYNLAVFLLDAGEVDAARAHAAAAAAGFERKLGADHVDVAMALDTVATVALRSSRAADAVTAVERALAIRIRAKAKPEALAYTRFDLAKALVAAKRDHRRARALAEEARGELERLSDPDGGREIAAWLRTAK